MPKHNKKYKLLALSLAKPFAIAIVIGLVIKFLFQKVQDAFGNSGDNIVTTKNNLNEVIKQSTEGSNISLTQSKVIADGLLAGFNGSGWFNSTPSGYLGWTGSTDEDSIFSLLDQEYNTDARQLIWASFGVKSYYLTGSPNFFSSMFASELTLGAWAVNELSGDDLVLFRNYFSNTIFNF